MKHPIFHFLVFSAALASGWLVARRVLLVETHYGIKSQAHQRPAMAPATAAASLDASLSRLEREPPSPQARVRLLSMIARANPGDIGTLLEWLPEHAPSLMPMFIDQWLEHDPEAFARALDLASPHSQWRIQWAQQFFGKWAEKNAQTAFARAEQFDPQFASWTVASVLEQVLKNDALQALRLAAQSKTPHHGPFPNSIPRHGEELLAHLAQIKSLPPSDYRDRGIAAAAGALAKTDVQAALQLAESIQDGRFSRHAKGQAVKGWVKANPDAARAFVETAEPNPLRISVASYFCVTYTNSRPAEVIPMALRWMKGDSRQHVLQHAFAALEMTDPAQAATLRETLPRPVPPPEF